MNPDIRIKIVEHWIQIARRNAQKNRLDEEIAQYRALIEELEAQSPAEAA